MCIADNQPGGPYRCSGDCRGDAEAAHTRVATLDRDLSATATELRAAVPDNPTVDELCALHPENEDMIRGFHERGVTMELSRDYVDESGRPLLMLPSKSTAAPPDLTSTASTELGRAADNMDRKRRDAKARALAAVADLPTPGDRHLRTAAMKVDNWERSDRAVSHLEHTQPGSLAANRLGVDEEGLERLRREGRQEAAQQYAALESRVAAGILRSDPESAETIQPEFDTGLPHTPPPAAVQARRRAQRLMDEYRSSAVGRNNETRAEEHARIERRAVARGELASFYAHGLMAAGEQSRP